MIRFDVYLHESLREGEDRFRLGPTMSLDLPAALHAYDHIGFGEDDPEPFTDRVLEVQRVTWYTRPTEDGAWAEVHVQLPTR